MRNFITVAATNAIKHGFTDDKEARFSLDLKKDDESSLYILTISNTGNAFPEKIDIDTSKSLGMQLISALVQQLGGSLELQKKPYPLFIIQFPVEKEE